MTRSLYLAALALALNTGLALPAVAVPAASPAPTPKTAPAVPVKSTAAVVNLNKASASELTERLVGVGPKKAEAIIAWRKANGGFKSTAQLMEVKGIGPSLYEKNKAQLSTR